MTLETFLNRWLPFELIEDCNHDPYLSRWFILRCQWLYIFIHKFHRSDEDRALHDHPWNYISLILRHGYWEHSEETCLACQHSRGEFCPACHGPEGYQCTICNRTGKIAVKKFIRAGSIIWRPATWRHRIELVDGKNAWTLIIRFKRRRDWGFWTAEGFVPWRQWWRANCE